MPNAPRFSSRTRLLIVFVATLFAVSIFLHQQIQSALALGGGSGSVSLTTLGSPYNQNFDTLANSGTTNNLTINGWYLNESGTATANNGQYAAGTGSGNSGDVYSFGATSSTERAFGTLLSGTLTPSIGAQFTNNTGSIITSLDVAYTGEMWRAGVTNRNAADRLDFQLSTNATSLTTGTWVDYNNLDYNSSNINATAGALVGNNPGNQTAVSFSITGLNIPNGASVWIRWTDFDISSSDDGLAIDSFSLTPNGLGPTNPTGVGAANPSSVPPGGTTLLTVAVTPGTNPPSLIHTVTADLSAIGGSTTQSFFDDGSNGDVTAGDNTFSYNATVANGTTGGAKNLPVTINETLPPFRTGNTSISLTVLTPTDPTGTGTANPSTVLPGESTLLTVNVTPGTNPTSTGLAVTADLSSIGGSANQSFSGSGNTFTYTATVAMGTTPGAKSLPFTITDAESRSGGGSISLTVDAPPPPNDVVISQIYGGGGNTGSTLTHDFIELINHSGSPVSLNGWSVQAFVSTTGTWQMTPLPNVTLQPGQYFLIQEAQGEGGTDELPEPDAIGTIPVSSTSTKVALLNNTTIITTSCPNAAAAGIVDLVGYGGTDCFEGSPAPALSNTTALLRLNNGCFDTNNNARDFVTGNPNPRNTSSPTNDCTGLSGVGSASPTSVVVGNSTTLTVHVAPAQNPTSTGITVTGDLSQIGGSATQAFSGGPTTFTFVANVPANNPTGVMSLPITIEDAQSRVGNTTIVVKVIPVVPDHVTISQLYGGGGNSGATYSHDYVELYNPHTTSFDLTGWSLQYASATGESWQVQPLGGSIAPGEYYLIGLATNNAAVGAPLPPANVNGDINMSGTTGKIALVNNFDALAGPCPISDLGIVDFLGYGTTASCAEGTRAPAPSNTTSLFRKNGGATDTDNNSADFVTGAPNPRRTAPIVEIGPSVFATDPRNNASSAPRDATIAINFTEPVTVDSGWYDITCGSTGNHNSATVRSFFGNEAYTITPNVNFLAGEQCTVTIFKDAIHDVDTDDSGTNADSLPANKVFTFTVATGAAPLYPASVHLTMGNPNGATADLGQPDNYLMEKPEFSLSYNSTRGTANWVSWHLSDDWVGTLARVDTFRADPEVPADWFRVSGFDYVGSGFDRGHMVPNADRDHQTSIPINQATFLMTNMLPQAPDNNQGPWANLEGYLRTLLPGNEVYIVAGGAGTGGTGSNGAANTIAGSNVTVPAETWKVAVIMPKDSGDDVARVNCSTRTLAVIVPNTQGIRNVNWETYITRVDAVEDLTGYDFFSNLPDAVENCVEAGTNGANVLATANQSASTQEDTAVEITLEAARPDADPITFSIVSEPTNGSLGTIGAPSCTDYACSATVTYTPNSNYQGSDSFTFKVSDGTNDSNTSTVTITVNSVNDDPDAVDDEATVAEDSGANTINVRANDSDVDGDTLTVTAVTQGANGSVAITNGGADVSFTPNANYFGPDSFTYTVEDGNGGSDTATVNVTVTNVNDAPVLTSSAAVSLIWPANSNLVNVGLTASATDEEGETVTIQVAVFGDEDDETPTTGTTIHSPDAKDIAPNTLRLRGERVEANDGRVYLIQVTATDTSGGVSRNYHTVVVPTANNPARRAQVNAQAAAALSYAQANNAPPPGYSVIGDGPIIGPKQ
jgi:DNA/RNA endonuclease G (NUC1)